MSIPSKKVLSMSLVVIILLSLFTVISPLSADAAAAAWAPNTYYAAGTQVTYSGSTYQCLQSHTSLVGWEPSNVPALWKKVGVGPTGNPTATPYNTPTPTGFNTPTPTKSSTPTPYNTPTPTSTSNGGGQWGSKVFAPYVDVMLYPTFDLTNCFNKTGQKYYTLAFVISDTSGNPAWGGVTPMSENYYMDQINSIRSKGGDVIVSFGGAAGTELAISNTNVSTLQAKYQSVIDKYKLTWVDFDIEGYAVAEKASIDRRNKAIKGLQARNPGLTIAYCLPVLPSGLTPDGEYVLSNAKANGVRVDVVNVMAMDYGAWAAPNPNGKMGDYAIQAATNTRSQCTKIGISPKIGVTPMIGQNDVRGEVFYQADARKLLTWAQSNSWVRLLSMWSSTRDNGSGGINQQASPKYSGIQQSEFEFTNIFKAFR